MPAQAHINEYVRNEDGFGEGDLDGDVDLVGDGNGDWWWRLEIDENRGGGVDGDRNGGKDRGKDGGGNGEEDKIDGLKKNKD